jgi:hypothetical protein
VVDEIAGGGWRTGDGERVQQPVVAEMNGERERKPEELAGIIPGADMNGRFQGVKFAHELRGSEKAEIG